MPLRAAPQAKSGAMPSSQDGLSDEDLFTPRRNLVESGVFTPSTGESSFLPRRTKPRRRAAFHPPALPRASEMAKNMAELAQLERSTKNRRGRDEDDWGGPCAVRPRRARRFRHPRDRRHGPPLASSVTSSVEKAAASSAPAAAASEASSPPPFSSAASSAAVSTAFIFFCRT